MKITKSFSGSSIASLSDDINTYLEENRNMDLLNIIPMNDTSTCAIAVFEKKDKKGFDCEKFFNKFQESQDPYKIVQLENQNMYVRTVFVT